MRHHGPRLRLLAATALMLICADCGVLRQPPPDPAPGDDRPARSQAVLDAAVGTGPVPGCSAAVGREGTVLWRGAQGVAVVDPESAITTDSTFDIGSVSKQFTALAVALLAQQGRLSLDDPVAKHLDGYPEWADEVTLTHLVHHTSGVADIDDLLGVVGISPEMEVSFTDLLAVIAEKAPALEFRPGSQWAYSNSNYLLLAAVAEEVAGQPFGDQLRQVFFDPLDLPMVLGPPLNDPDRTRSYRVGATGKFEIIDTNGDARGATGIRATPSDLVRWADVYRTGTVGGPLVTEPDPDAADGAYENSRYGLGIFIGEDGELWHDGGTGGFRTAFAISADRTMASSVTCNSIDHDPWKILEELVPIWTVT